MHESTSDEEILKEVEKKCYWTKSSIETVKMYDNWRK
jgi:hypothetical protein